MAGFRNINDIAHDLKTLGFESGLSSEEIKFLPLRTRSHAFTTCICANAAYFIAKLNEIREILSEIRHPVNRKTLKFVKHHNHRNAVKVGLIGGGRLGSQIASTVMTFSDVRPDEIIISTRKPHELTSFRDSGVDCVYDNKKVVQSCHIVFLACLPCQVQTVAEEVKNHIARDCVIYSVVTAVSLPRLKQLFRHNNVIKTEFTWPTPPQDISWPMGCNVVDTLQNKEYAEVTCPVSTKASSDGIIWPNTKLCEVALYAALNMCPLLSITAEEAMHLINLAFVGPKNADLSWSTFLDENSSKLIEDGNLPVFDLFHVGMNDTPLTAALKTNDELRTAITQRYCTVFDRFKSSDKT